MGGEGLVQCLHSYEKRREEDINFYPIVKLHCSLFFSEAIQQAEMRERGNQITELTEKLANETDGRRMAEEQRNDLEQRLVRDLNKIVSCAC